MAYIIPEYDYNQVVSTFIFNGFIVLVFWQLCDYILWPLMSKITSHDHKAE
jgi:hypothetical protein